MCIGLDCDGTLACWVPSTPRDYDDPEEAMLHAAALVGPIAWLKTLIKAGQEVVIISGRDHSHTSTLHTWLRVIVGARIPVYLRPESVGLSCAAQAEWKCSVIKRLRLDVYVGDNDGIDLPAAMRAGAAYQPIAPIIEGAQPRFLTMEHRQFRPDP